MKTTGIAYGFLLSDKSLLALEEAFANGRDAIETSTTLHIALSSLQPAPQLLPHDEYSNLVRLALNAGMNYAVVATLPGTSNYSAREKLTALMDHVHGREDQGVFYIPEDSKGHFVQNRTIRRLEVLV